MPNAVIPISDLSGQNYAGCRGDGYFEGPGNFTMAYGTFNGYGFINGTSGSFTGALLVRIKLTYEQMHHSCSAPYFRQARIWDIERVGRSISPIACSGQ